jgi:uncharacterized protein (TIGR02246 family)
MTSQTATPIDSPTADEVAVRSLYHRLIDGWNRRSCDDFASTFAEDCYLVGFDGSQVAGRSEIAAHLRPIFVDHPTPAYVGKVRGVTFLAPDAAVLRAVVGMVPPGHADLEPKLNAVQSLVAAKRDGEWSIVLFQNTPAQFHGRPELAQELTEELRQLL